MLTGLITESLGQALLHRGISHCNCFIEDDYLRTVRCQLVGDRQIRTPDRVRFARVPGEIGVINRRKTDLHGNGLIRNREPAKP
jgi:hypothetical protein